MRINTLVLFLAVSFPFSAFAAKDPLPAELMQAKTVYIQMGHFVPTKKNDDQGVKASYFEPCYQTLSKWGRFKVVSDPKEADIIFQISSQAERGSQLVNTAQVRGTVSTTNVITTIDVIQTSSGNKLWSGDGIWVWAFSAKWIPRNIVNSLRKEVEAQVKMGGDQIAAAPALSTGQPSPGASLGAADAPTSAATRSGSPVTPPAQNQPDPPQN